MKTFRIVTLGIFIAGIIGAVVVFNMGITTKVKCNPNQISIWGTLPVQMLKPMFDEMKLELDICDKSYIIYEFHPADDVVDDLKKTIVDRDSQETKPQIIIAPSSIHVEMSKLNNINLQSVRSQDYISGAAVITEKPSNIATPFLVDPMIMYYNYEILDSAGVVGAKPPETWKEFSLFVAEATKVDNKTAEIQVSGGALGDIETIQYGEDILATLFLQSGSTFVTQEQGYQVSLATNISEGLHPLDFFNQFSNFSSSLYSWDTATTIFAQDEFTRGKLAIFFAPASAMNEIFQYSQFDVKVAPVPQVSNTTRSVYSDILSVYTTTSLVETEDRLSEPELVLAALLNKSSEVAKMFCLAPARRDLISSPNLSETPVCSQDAHSVIYSSAVYSQPWLKPDIQTARDIFSAILDTSRTLQAKDAATEGETLIRNALYQ